MPTLNARHSRFQCFGFPAAVAARPPADRLSPRLPHRASSTARSSRTSAAPHARSCRRRLSSTQRRDSRERRSPTLSPPTVHPATRYFLRSALLEPYSRWAEIHLTTGRPSPFVVTLNRVPVPPPPSPFPLAPPAHALRTASAFYYSSISLLASPTPDRYSTPTNPGSPPPVPSAR